MEVLVSGGSGLIGTALRKVLGKDGHHPIQLTRSPGKRSGDAVGWDPASGEIDAASIEGVDAVVHLAGEPLLGRWTEAKKRRIRRSRVQGTRLLAETLAGLDRPPKVLLSGSAVGYYGDRSEEVLTEDSDPGEGFLAQVCQEWELTTRPAEEAGIRVCHLRTGLVQARDADLVKLQLWAFKLGLGAKLGDGRQWFPWIHIDDHVRAQLLLLDHDEASGPFNLTAPNPVRNVEYADTLAEVLNRPRFLFVPVPAIGLVFGRTAAEEMIAVSQRAVPARLSEEDFRFEHADLTGALRAEMG